MKDRRQIILDGIEVGGRGLEIGPSHSPITPKREGFRVKILDHMDRKGLLRRFEGHGVDLDAIEEVDFVWNGESYSELVGEQSCFDWIIASHVVEHTPDLIGFLRDCEGLLAEDGVLSLAIPDKRFCFDRFRPISSLSQVIDCHAENRRTHSPGSAAEFFLNVVSYGGQIAWEPNAEGELVFIHQLEEAVAGMRRADEKDSTLDLHSWCFVPSSFRLLVHDLSALGLIRLKEHSFETAGGSEFFTTLSVSGSGPEDSRKELLLKIEKELGSV